MEMIIIGFIAVFISVATSTLINKKKENKRALTYEQGQQLAQRIKATEQEQKKQTETYKKLDNKILAQTQEFNNIDRKRIHKLKDIEKTLDIINLRLQEKGKNNISLVEAQKLIKDVPDDFNELDSIEEEIKKLKYKDIYKMKI
jgi:type II secretory pathway pseudopilin PulG